jgi:hypothetical protein
MSSRSVQVDWKCEPCWVYFEVDVEEEVPLSELNIDVR